MKHRDIRNVSPHLFLAAMLVFGFGAASPPVSAQSLAPNSNYCDTVEVGSVMTPTETRSQACVHLDGRTFASSEYTKWPGDGEWDALEHSACVSTTHESEGLVGSGCQTKYQTSGIACPIVWVTSAGNVTVDGDHTYQDNPDSSFKYTVQTHVEGYQGGADF